MEQRTIRNNTEIMIGGVQPKVLLTQDVNDVLHLSPELTEALGITESEFNWRLVRERDGLVNRSKEILWLEWNEDGRFKEKHDDIAVGRSLIMSPFNHFFTWQTTSVTEVLEVAEDLSYIKFKTKNSTYELFKL
jgi:YD repeat-containing protein